MIWWVLLIMIAIPFVMFPIVMLLILFLFFWDSINTADESMHLFKEREKIIKGE